MNIREKDSMEKTTNRSIVEEFMKLWLYFMEFVFLSFYNLIAIYVSKYMIE